MPTASIVVGGQVDANLGFGDCSRRGPQVPKERFHEIGAPDLGCGRGCPPVCQGGHVVVESGPLEDCCE